ncbi:MAG: ADP-forming succinate--CoA ligase subunit beta [Planctomycetes bacterium]|nr:ADP-forming succinate--CoA ligase subunit beta [Planctomycetota bacterium]
MKLHEYQAKGLLSQFGVPVPPGRVAATPQEAEEAARALATETVVVKAQIHAGGRGKGGGVKVVRGPAAAREAAQAILGMNLVTHQTGPGGRRVKRVLVEAGCAVERELYAGVVLDRARERPVLMASAQGGMDIEVVAARDPAAILKEWFDPGLGLHPFQARRLAYALGLAGEAATRAADLFVRLSGAFRVLDATLVEVNPMVVTLAGEVLALDAKLGLDDSALWRHQDLAKMRDLDEEEPTERRASDGGLSYVKLDGDIGCLVNGAGLAMATMDIIQHHGGTPANFLDVGGGATEAQVTEAFTIILEDPHVKAILVNIFGGILQCDVLAQGVVEAARKVSLGVPLVVRLEGTNVEQGRRILQESGLALQAATDMADAARKAVAASRGERKGRARRP